MKPSTALIAAAIAACAWLIPSSAFAQGAGGVGGTGGMGGAAMGGMGGVGGAAVGAGGNGSGGSTSSGNVTSGGIGGKSGTPREDGCTCHAVGRTRDGHWGLWAAGACVALFYRRRRRCP